MKIERIRLHVVRQELGRQRFCYSQAWYGARTMLLLEMTTDTGVTGWGEAFGNPHVNLAILEHVYLPMVLGRDPLDRAVLWRPDVQRVARPRPEGSDGGGHQRRGHRLVGHCGQGAGPAGLSADGRGGTHACAAYATGFYRTPDTTDANLIDEALLYAEQGFTGMKVKVGFGVEHDARLIRDIRRAVGDRVALMIDANHAYNATDALALARRVEDLEIGWFEEPVPPEDLRGYCEVRNGTTIPISGGEAEFTRYGFARLLDARAVDIVQPDCCVTGGLSEFANVAMLATIHDIRCCPHIWGSAVALQTGLHAAFSLPDYPESLTPAPVWLEYDRSTNVLREELNLNRIRMVDGWIDLPERPGLGFEVNRDVLEHYRICELERSLGQ